MDDLTRIEFHGDLALAALIFLAERDELDNYDADQITADIKKLSSDHLNRYLTILNGRTVEDRLEYPDSKFLKSMLNEESQP